MQLHAIEAVTTTSWVPWYYGTEAGSSQEPTDLAVIVGVL
jgi:hypothetical protein